MGLRDLFVVTKITKGSSKSRQSTAQCSRKAVLNGSVDVRTDAKKFWNVRGQVNENVSMFIIIKETVIIGMKKTLEHS